MKKTTAVMIGMIFVLMILVFITGLVNAKTMAANKVGFEIKDGDGKGVADVLVSLNGVSDPNFKSSMSTDANGMAVFDNVPGSAIYAYALFKTGYKSSTGSVFVTGDKNIKVVLQSLDENTWWDYYKSNGEAEISLKSFDDDTIYNGGEKLNYEVKIRNIGAKDISVTQDDIKINVYDEYGSGIEWGKLNPNRKFQAAVKPSGYLKVRAEGNDVKVTVSNSVITYDGKTVSVNNDEFVSISIQTRDNVIPSTLNGKFYLISTGYYITEGIKKSVGIKTQTFKIQNPGTDLSVKNLQMKNVKGRYYANFDIVNAGNVDAGGVFYEVQNGGKTYHNKAVLRIDAGKTMKASVKVNDNGSTTAIVDYQNIIQEVNEANNMASA